MFVFVLGFGLVQAVVIAIAVIASGRSGGLPAGSLPALALALLVVPTGAAWAAGLSAARLAPRRLFDPRVRRPLARFGAGVLAALGAIVPMTLAVTVLSEHVHDAVATGSCAALAASGAVFLLPRRRPGFCVHCAYDLSAVPDCPRCPECGQVGSG